MRYKNPTVIAQRKALVQRLVNRPGRPSVTFGWLSDTIEERLAYKLEGRLGQRLFLLAEDGQAYDSVWAADEEAALEEAVDRFDESFYERGSTNWVEIEVYDAVLGDRLSILQEVTPVEPSCTNPKGHDWRAPYSVLGGLKENPGVWGSGGGAIIKEVCANCGGYRITDTWATGPNGEQGYVSIQYEDPDEASLAWAASRHAKEAA